MAVSVADVAVKVPAHTVAPKTGPWTTSREPASLWRSEIDGKNVINLLLNCAVVEPYKTIIVVKQYNENLST